MSPDNNFDNQPTPTPAPTPTPEPTAPITEPATEPDQPIINPATPAEISEPTPEPAPATEPTPMPTPAPEPIPTPEPAPATEPTPTPEPVQPTTVPIQPTEQPKKKLNTPLIIIAIVGLCGVIFGILVATGIIKFGGSGGLISFGSSYSVPTSEKIEEVCKKHGKKFQKAPTNSTSRFYMVDLPYEVKTEAHACSEDIEIDLHSKDLTEIIADTIKEKPELANEIDAKPHAIAKMLSLTISYSYQGEKHELTFTPIEDTDDYYMAKAGENGENDKGYLIVYKNVLVQTNGQSDEINTILKELGLKK